MEKLYVSYGEIPYIDRCEKLIRSSGVDNVMHRRTTADLHALRALSEI